MLVHAALVPDTALLVPGASGARTVLADVRAAAVDAARALLADAPARVVVVAGGPADRTRRGPFAPTLAAAGIPEAALGWGGPPLTEAGSAGPPAGDRVLAPAAATLLLLLAHAGWTGPVTLVEVAPADVAPGGDASVRPAPRRADGLAGLGRDLTSGPEPVGLLAGGSLSARHGDRAPLAGDPRAADADDAVLADLRDGGPGARRRLAAWDPGLAADLAVTAWAPLQVLVGAVPPGSPVRAEVPVVAAPWGVPYVVASWRPA